MLDLLSSASDDSASLSSLEIGIALSPCEAVSSSSVILVIRRRLEGATTSGSFVELDVASSSAILVRFAVA